ncbi:MAG: 50S ribosomal protein L25, partial [Anaerohalosphaeraceae bacterium]
NVELRERVGSKTSSRLREQGKLPAVIYGHKQHPVSIALDTHSFMESLHHGHRIFSVELPEGTQALLLKDLQYDYLGKKVIHVDMVRVDLNERVTVEVPLVLRGTAKGAQGGGVVDQLMSSVEIECPVLEIPENLPVVIKELEIGDSITASQIPLSASCVLKSDPKALVAICHEVAEIKTTEEVLAEQPATPEVITERAPKEGEEEAK